MALDRGDQQALKAFGLSTNPKTLTIEALRMLALNRLRGEPDGAPARPGAPKNKLYPGSNGNLTGWANVIPPPPGGYTEGIKPLLIRPPNGFDVEPGLRPRVPLPPLPLHTIGPSLLGPHPLPGVRRDFGWNQNTSDFGPAPWSDATGRPFGYDHDLLRRFLLERLGRRVHPERFTRSPGELV